MVHVSYQLTSVIIIYFNVDVISNLFILAPDQWTMVPVLVKMYKLIINELSTQIEQATAAARGDLDDGDNEDEVSEDIKMKWMISKIY